MTSLITTIFGVFGYIVLGFLIKKTNIISDRFLKFYNFISFNLLLPIALITNFWIIKFPKLIVYELIITFFGTGAKYLDTLNKNKEIYIICGMMKNKIHKEFISNFKIANEILAVDIPNNNNCIKKEELKKIIEKTGIKARTINSIEDAVKYAANKNKDSIIFIVGSIFLVGEVLNLG